MSFLNALDPNVACRELRELLLASADALGTTPARIPHSFDVSELLAFATRRATARDVKRQPRIHLPLLAATGVALALSGRDEEGVGLLRRGYRDAGTNQTRAQYLYRIGYHSEHRRGDAHAARETLHRAYVLSERSRRLRGEILLALGTVEASTGSIGSAERALSGALDLSLRELEPHALLRASDVATLRADFGTAVDLNRRSHALFRAREDFLGMKVCDSNLAILRLERSELTEASELLDRVIEQGLRVLDICRLGRDYNNRAVLLSQAGDPAAARDSVIEAIRFHEAFGRKALLIGNYQNLGGYLVQLGETDAALAAFDTAAGLARRLNLVHREFQVLAHLLLMAALHRLAFPELRSVRDRCRHLMESDAESLSKKSLVSFARAMDGFARHRELLEPNGHARGSHGSLAGPDGWEALGRLVPSPDACDFTTQLERRLGEGLPGRDVPPNDDLARFLMQFIGEFFKSGNYTREFSITQERAKRHLRWMCRMGLIEQRGARKASRYSLAFHRS